LLAVVIAEDRAGTDIRARADAAVADIGEMIGLGALPDLDRLHLDEIADANSRPKFRARPQPRERTDRRALADMRALQMAERVDHGVVFDNDPRPEHHVRLDRDVLAELGVGAEIN